jgi:hypothetical protein
MIMLLFVWVKGSTPTLTFSAGAAQEFRQQIAEWRPGQHLQRFCKLHARRQV